MGEWWLGQWIVGVISFQKIFGLCGLKGHIVEIRWDVTLVHGRTDGQRTTVCEDRARILKQNSQFFRIPVSLDGGSPNGDDCQKQALDGMLPSCFLSWSCDLISSPLSQQQPLFGNCF